MKSFSLLSSLLLLLCAVMPVPLASAFEVETAAESAILIDMQTGEVLFEKNADQRIPTASMSKVMTMYMVFEALADGRLSLDDTLPVSEKAWRKGGSKMFVRVGDDVRVEDLVRGVIVQSGNDATIVLAEGLAGSEEAFADEMTARAREIGMENSRFRNASGWPDPDHYSTARDLAILATRMISDFPQYYRYYSETEFTYGVDFQTGRPITQANRNPLLYRNIGADGVKTGHTEEAGYGLIGSAVEDDRRLVVVVSGLDSTRARGRAAEQLLRWGFREFENVRFFEAGETVAHLPVWLGAEESVPLITEQGAFITIPKRSKRDMEVSLRMRETVAAPILAGQSLATVTIDIEGREPLELPLVAEHGVEREGFPDRLFSAASYLLFGARSGLAGEDVLAAGMQR